MSGNDGTALLVALAVDDEKGALSDLAYVLEGEPRIGTVLTASNAYEALSMLRGESAEAPERVDVVFMDIRMPGLDGLELARVLGMISDPPVAVFVTAYEDRAIEAFDVGAVDYLMKPVSPERLSDTMRRIVRTRTAPAATPEGDDEITGDEEVIPVELAGTTKLVPRSSVRWVEAQGDYARLHTGDGSHLVRIPLSQLEDRWSDAGFVRIHRSFLVSLALVTELRMSPSGYMVRVGSGTEAAELPVSRRHTRALKDRLVRAAKQGWNER
ncbi:MAG: response regulator [Pseudonocardiaceae bacterium]|nr:response regulator [Pseudonocardiaceae bacterium]